VARRKQRNKSRVRTLILFLLIPLIVWFLAFLLWFYWYDLRKAFTKEDAPPRRSKPARQVETDERRESVPAKPPKEQILDDDRKSLEDILKRRN
jgi:hypothetical protein